MIPNIGEDSLHLSKKDCDALVKSKYHDGVWRHSEFTPDPYLRIKYDGLEYNLYRLGDDMGYLLSISSAWDEDVLKLFDAVGIPREVL